MSAEKKASDFHVNRLHLLPVISTLSSTRILIALSSFEDLCAISSSTAMAWNSTMDFSSMPFIASDPTTLYCSSAPEQDELHALDQRPTKIHTDGYKREKKSSEPFPFGHW